MHCLIRGRRQLFNMSLHLQEEATRLQELLVQTQQALEESEVKAGALEAECSALRAAVEEAEATCRNLQSRLSAAEVRRSSPLYFLITGILLRSLSSAAGGL